MNILDWTNYVIRQHNLDVPTSFFWKDLLRHEGNTVGRLDSRYKGLDRNDAGVRPDFNSELTSWLHSFTPAINYYFKNELNYETDIKYNMFGPVRPWDRSGDNTGEKSTSGYGDESIYACAFPGRIL